MWPCLLCTTEEHFIYWPQTNSTTLCPPPLCSFLFAFVALTSHPPPFLSPSLSASFALLLIDVNKVKRKRSGAGLCSSSGSHPPTPQGLERATLEPQWRPEREGKIPAALQLDAANATMNLWSPSEVLSGRTGSPVELQGESNSTHHKCHAGQFVDLEQGWEAQSQHVHLSLRPGGVQRRKSTSMSG